MKRKLYLILIAILLLFSVTISLVACGEKQEEVDAPRFYEQEIEIGTDYIKIKSVYTPYEDLVAEYRLNDNGKWQKENEFKNLTSGTEYTIFLRTAESKKYKQSEEVSIKITTLKAEQSAIPEVKFTQEGKKIVLNGFTEEMEVCWDSKNENWTQVSEYEYKTNGEYIIKIRYKESNTSLTGEAQEIKVVISDYAGGNGTEENPYLISNYKEFSVLMEDCNKSLDNYYKIVEDITFPNTPVTFAKGTQTNSNLGGYIDGNNKKIINPKITDSDRSRIDVGIINRVKSIKNLNIVNAEINYTETSSRKDDTGIGVLVGCANEIINCHVTGTINVSCSWGKNIIGGIAGILETSSNYENGLIKKSSAEINMTINENKSSGDVLKVGGIVGELFKNEKFAGKFNNSNFNLSRLKANVNLSFNNCADINTAGILGYMNNQSKLNVEINNSISTGEIVYTNDNVITKEVVAMGGIAGQFSGNVTNCVSDLDIKVIDRTTEASSSGKLIYLAGIVGFDQPWTKAENRVIKNVLYCGEIYIEKEESTVITMYGCDSMANSASGGNLTIENAWHAGILGIAAGENSYPADSDDEYLTVAWQKDTLKLDENIWNLVEGKLPTIK